jgi:hypothetical protein
MGLKVFKECCKNCLLSPDRIVSPKRAKEIINGCVKNQTYFICHKATMDKERNGSEVVCKTFYDTLGYRSQMIRIAQRLNAVEFIEQSDSEKLPTHTEMTKKSKNKR